MRDLKLEVYLGALMLLERRLGSARGYQMLDPFPLDAADIVAINRAAHRIAEFVGLGEHTYVVAVRGQDEGVAGNIELHHGEPGAFIEVSSETVQFEDAVLATLCHEITHKFLHIRQISVPGELRPDLDDEALTDMTSVYLGLGKLMLRGSECKKVTTEEGPQGRVTTTRSSRFGYLNSTQLSLIYLLCCTMRRIPVHSYEQGLRPEELARIYECRNANSPFLGGGWYGQIEKNGLDMPGSFARTISDLDRVLAELGRDLLQIQGYVRSGESLLERLHVKIHKARQVFVDAQQAPEPDPCLRYLDAVQRLSSAELLEGALKDCASHAKACGESAERASTLMASSWPHAGTSGTESLSVVTCKVCGKKLRLPENSTGLTVKCPGCRRQFRAITAKRQPLAETSGWRKAVRLFRHRP